ncbi:hypothetical protein D3C86_2106770 [compost metagenome]
MKGDVGLGEALPVGAGGDHVGKGRANGRNGGAVLMRGGKGGRGWLDQFAQGQEVGSKAHFRPGGQAPGQ